MDFGAILSQKAQSGFLLDRGDGHSRSPLTTILHLRAGYDGAGPRR
jgi:hypothetical protein